MYVIKATKFTDNTYNEVVFENQNLSRKVTTFGEAKHILDLDFAIATDDKLKFDFSGTELTICNEDGSILKEWIEKVA